VLSGLTIGSLVLSPTFTAEVKNYTASTTNKTNVINATTDSEGATIGITLSNASDTNKSVTNGNAVTWADGDNTIQITVAKDGAETTYTVVVTKE
jgi:hypothetical protein